MENRTRICICYLISGALIAFFVYSLAITHFSVISQVENLTRQVEDISKVLLGKDPKEYILPQIECHVKRLTDGIWDELAAVKKKVEHIDVSGCSVCGSFKGETDLQSMKVEDPNYALVSAGAAIVYVEDTPFHQSGYFSRLFGYRHKTNCPEKMLDPSMQLGNCYAFRGHKASLVIRLSHVIIIRSVTVEHISPSASLTGDISNAPKDFSIYGLSDRDDRGGDLLGSFQYNNSLTRRAQTFNLKDSKKFRYCKIVVNSNYGNRNYTCIYRVAIHGIYK